MHASIWTYAFDLVDEGIHEALRRIRDDGGLTSLSLATSYHAGKALLPHNPKRKVVYLEDGTVYFQPQRAWYAGLKIQPQLNSLCRHRNVLAEVVEEAKKIGLKVIAWTVCCHNYELGQLHPDCTVQNCFGDRYLTTLCPANEHVRQYLIALTGDLASNYDLYAIELESLDYMSFTHGFHHEKTEIALPPMMHLFLSLCFCGFCKEAARQRGADADAVEHFVCSELEAFFDEPTELSRREPTWEAVSGLMRGQMGQYLLSAMENVSTLLAEIAEEVRGKHETRVHVISFGRGRPSALWQMGVDFDRLAELADAVEVLAYGSPPDELRRILLVNQQLLRGKADLIIGLHPSEKYVGTKETFLEQVRLCKQHGVNAFSFYNYGLLSLRHLRWIREALAQG